MKSLSLALAAALTIAAPAVAGAPWISIELPANPMDRGTQGAFAVVHTYLHERPMPYLVVGTAEGLVNNQRRSQPLTITSTGRTGTMAIAKSWPSDGVWVLSLAVEGAPLNAAIGVDAGGEVAFVRVPMDRNGNARPFERGEVEALLRALAAGERVPALTATR